jgi:hypothetical protein
MVVVIIPKASEIQNEAETSKGSRLAVIDSPDYWLTKLKTSIRQTGHENAALVDVQGLGFLLALP